jgi:hypothetical protein
MAELPKLISLPEAAAVIGVSVSGAHYLVLKGELSVRRVGGRYVVLLSDAAMLTERRRTRTPEDTRGNFPITRVARL